MKRIWKTIKDDWKKDWVPLSLLVLQYACIIVLTICACVSPEIQEQILNAINL